MRKVITSNIVGTTGQPIKSGTLEHLQLAYEEAIQIILNNLLNVGSASSSVFILYGCVNTGGSTIGTTCVISAGAVYYNGEIYFVPATSFLIAVGLVAVIDTAQTSTNFYVDAKADPVTMTDLTTPFVHSKFQVTIVDGNSGATGFIANYSAFKINKSAENDKIAMTTLTTGTVTTTGGSVSNVVGGVITKRNPVGMYIANNAFWCDLAGSPTAVKLNLSALLDSGLSYHASFLLSVWDGTNAIPCRASFSTTLNIVRLDGAAFNNTTHYFYFSGFVIEV